MNDRRQEQDAQEEELEHEEQEPFLFQEVEIHPSQEKEPHPSRPGWNKKESLVKKYLYSQNSV